MRAKILRMFGRLGGYRIFESLARREPLVVLYHGVTTNESSRGSENYRCKHIPLRAFTEQIDWLRRHFEIVPLDVIERSVAERRQPTVATAAVTFDDGYRNNYVNAFPVLRDRGIPATLFVTTGFVDQREPLWVDRLEYAINQLPIRTAEKIARDAKERSRLKMLSRTARDSELPPADEQVVKQPDYAPLSWDEIRELHRAGWNIGAHTVTHPILSRETADAQREEIKTSYDRLRAEVGECKHFAYPDGQPGTWNGETKKILRELGIIAAWTTEMRRVCPRREQDAFELPRIALDASHRDGRFELLATNLIPAIKKIL